MDYQYNGFLHELMDIFVSILYEYVPEDYPLRPYFVSCIADSSALRKQVTFCDRLHE